MTVAIPNWNSQGLLPPVDPAAPTSAERSPYAVSLKDVVMRFATTPARHSVMNGFLDYRATLHSTGLLDGFQWLDGSFMEDVETLESRPPNDIDIVTFLYSSQFNPGNLDPLTLMNPASKTQFKVDAYFVELDVTPPHELTLLSAYWYSVWSHRRNDVWKGYLQVDLAPNEDADAIAWLNQSRPAGAGP